MSSALSLRYPKLSNQNVISDFIDRARILEEQEEEQQEEEQYSYIRTFDNQFEGCGAYTIHCTTLHCTALQTIDYLFHV